MVDRLTRTAELFVGNGRLDAVNQQELLVVGQTLGFPFVALFVHWGVFGGLFRKNVCQVDGW